jgi:alkylation response protein AidB-like acyl-CoA dehydrogenase
VAKINTIGAMTIAITEDHRALADTAGDFLAKHGSLAAARALLEAPTETAPPFWDDLVALGWLGLHLPEAHGGSGYGLPELVIVVEALGRALAPGAFVPTVIASATLASDAASASAAGEQAQARWLPGLASGETAGAVALAGEVELRDGLAHGSAGVVLGGGLADLVLVGVGDDVAIIDVHDAGVTVTTPPNLDPTRRAARVVLDGAPATVLPGARQTLVDLARVIIAAEAVGVARECTEQAAAYAKVREQFGRPIAMFQAVKHHCANMLVATELATAAVWDAARAAGHGGEQLTYTAAVAATLALPAGYLCAQLNTQVHGGIGFTWEHDAHLFVRRSTALEAVIDADAAAAQLTDLTRAGVHRERSIDLPPEAEPIRETVREFVASLAGLDESARRDALIETGYVMPHWPEPWGRGADAVEQLVIEQEFAAGGVTRPAYSITGWVILTLIQYATEDQVSRWVRPALTQEVIWCQLFSEPDAGSDAAGIKTRGTRVDGGWLVNGQKVWTSGAHVAGFGLATVRTDPDVPKHDGITTMVIDMHAEGVEVRPLKMPSGGSEFNEVFFNDVFVPDDDVVGPVDGGWTVARATLGNESVSIGGGEGGMSLPAQALVGPFDAHPERLVGGAGRIGRYAATSQAATLLNVRRANRAIAGGGPGPEGNVTKLVLSEIGHEAAAILVELAGPETVFLDGEGTMAGMMVLMNRALSIAGGTSEIKRNQIGERILGLPRDPLIN